MAVPDIGFIGGIEEMDGHDAEVVIGPVDIGFQKFKSILEIAGSDTSTFIHEEVYWLVFVAPDGHWINEVGAPQALYAFVVGVLIFELGRHQRPIVVLEVCPKRATQKVNVHIVLGSLQHCCLYIYVYVSPY